jgi:hypothetical protein
LVFDECLLSGYDIIQLLCIELFGAQYHNKIKSSMEMLPANYKKCMIQRSPQDRFGEKIGELKRRVRRLLLLADDRLKEVIELQYLL